MVLSIREVKYVCTVLHLGSLQLIDLPSTFQSSALSCNRLPSGVAEELAPNIEHWPLLLRTQTTVGTICKFYYDLCLSKTLL